MSGGGRSKGRNNSGSSGNHNTNGSSSSSPRVGRSSLPSQQSTTRSCSPTTTVSNASSSKKSSTSLGFGMSNNNNNKQQHSKQKQQQQQQQQQKQQQQNNPPLPPTVTVNSNSRLYPPATSSIHSQQQQPSNMLAPLTGAVGTTLTPPPPHPKKMDILKVLAEVEGGSFQVTWRECFWIGVALAFLAMCSIAVGIAAGMTISIHYYGQEIRVLPKQKATMLDPAIALTNVAMMKASTPTSSSTGSNFQINHSNSKQQQRHQHSLTSLDLGRVITTSKSGQRDMLSVVEELPPLPNEQDDFAPAISQKNQPSLPPIRSLLNFSQPTVLPKLCSDGETMGFDDWHVLRKAIQEANALSAERFMKWNEYMARYPAHHHHQYHQQRQRKQHLQRQKQQQKQSQHQNQRRGNSPSLSERYNHPDDDDNDGDDDMSFWYYQEEVVFTICPNAVLTARKNSPPIFINAEHIRLECDDCLIVKPGTHIDFGRHAQDVWIRGITFSPSTKPSRAAVASNGPASLTFYHDGARANVQDCLWLNYHQHHADYHNRPNHDPNNPNSLPRPTSFSYYSWFAPVKIASQPEPLWGTVADVNSSSTVNFYRCRIGLDYDSLTPYPMTSRASYRL